MMINTHGPYSLYNCKQASLNSMPEDMILEIVTRCFNNRMECLGALLLTDKKLHMFVTCYIKFTPITYFCPNLTFLNFNANIEHCSLNKKCALISAYEALEPFVEDGTGISCMTMPKGALTFANMQCMAEKKGLLLTSWGWRIQEKGVLPEIKQGYDFLITNNCTKGSYSKLPGEQSKILDEKGCRLPTAQELGLFCISIDAEYPREKNLPVNHPDHFNSSPYVGCVSTELDEMGVFNVTRQGTYLEIDASGQVICKTANRVRIVFRCDFNQNRNNTNNPRIGASACRQF